MYTTAVSFLLAVALASSSPLPHRFGNNAKNVTVKISECGYCSHYFETGNSPYRLLMIISKSLDANAQMMMDDLLMDPEELRHAEKLFSDYCDRHCVVGKRSMMEWEGKPDSSSSASAAEGGNPSPNPDLMSQQSGQMNGGPPPVGQHASEPEMAWQETRKPPMPGPEGVSSGAVVSGFDISKTGGSGTAALTGHGATLLGGGLGDEGDVQGSVSTDDRGHITFMGGVDNGGYVAGAMSQGGSASGSSSVNEQGKGTVAAAVENGGTAFGMTGGTSGSVSGNLEQNSQTVESSASLYSTRDTGAGAISGVGSGVSGSSSVATTNSSDNNGLSIISKDANSTITGVVTLGQASVSGSGTLHSVAGSVATSGGKGSVASASGVAAASNSFDETGMTNAVSSGGGFAGGSIVTGDAAGSAVSSDDAIASSVSGNTGTGIGSSTSGNSSSSGMVKNGAVIASASTVQGLASSVTTTGKGVAGGSGTKSAGVSMGVANQHGSASGSATGKGASVATSTGHRAYLTLASSKKKGSTATAISSRFLSLHQQQDKSRKVKILRIHCDEAFCNRYPLELCCDSASQQSTLR